MSSAGRFIVLCFSFISHSTNIALLGLNCLQTLSPDSLCLAYLLGRNRYALCAPYYHFLCIHSHLHSRSALPLLDICTNYNIKCPPTTLLTALTWHFRGGRSELFLSLMTSHTHKQCLPTTFFLLQFMQTIFTFIICGYTLILYFCLFPCQFWRVLWLIWSIFIRPCDSPSPPLTQHINTHTHISIPFFTVSD